jgi:hypothetical protein
VSNLAPIWGRATCSYTSDIDTQIDLATAAMLSYNFTSTRDDYCGSVAVGDRSFGEAECVSVAKAALALR